MRSGLVACWAVAAMVLGMPGSPGASVALGQTIVGGFIRQDTTWTLAGSPYMVRSTVEVTDGAVLTIEPGVEVVFDDRQGLDSTNGVLIADGQGGDRIVFRSASGAARSWSGITTSVGVSSVTTPEGDYASGPIFRNVRIADADGAVRGHLRPVHFEDVVIERCVSPAIQIQDRQSDSTIWFKGVTVRESGVGLVMSEARRVMLLDCVFEDNAGGGVRINRGSGEMARCAFRRNGLTSVTFGGGGAYLGRGSWNIRDCVFEGNEAVNTSTGSGGGGLYLSSFFSTITDCDFIANTSTAAGGGAEVSPAHTDSRLRVERCRFVDNESLESSGGGLLAGAGTLSTLLQVEVVDCAFEGNRGDRNGGLVLGLHSGEVSGSTFERNTARTSGGALRIYNQVTDLLIRDNEFVENTTEAAGGAIDLTSVVSSRGLRIEANAFRGNTADTGGAVGGLGPSSIDLAGNTFEGNSARLGGALHVRSGAFDAVSLAGSAPNRFSGNSADLGDAIYNDSSLAIDATGNCWGTDDLAAIAERIYDASDDPTKGVVAFDPIGDCTPCPADLDADGELTIFDFLAFQNLFDAGDPAADFDGDGALTIFDFLAFQNAFDAGC